MLKTISVTVLAAAFVLASLSVGTGGEPAPRPEQGPSLRQLASRCAEKIAFRHSLDDAPIELSFRPKQVISPAVEQFHCTGENPYSGEEEAIAAGKKLYKKYCRACHLPDGSGRIGPNLVDEKWQYERTGKDVGKFEIIYAGGAGAMQAFGRRMDQDDILKVMAYLEVLDQK